MNESTPTLRESVSKVNKSNGRELRGQAIAELGDQITKLSPHTYKVVSQSGNGEYEVLRTED